MEVLNAVLHQIDKTAGIKQGLAKVQTATDVLPTDSVTAMLAGSLMTLYKGSTVYAVFQEDKRLYTFQSDLASCIDLNWDNFLGFTGEAVKLLASKMVAASAGGYVLFIRYKERQEEYLFIVMLNNEVGASVTNDLKLKESIHLHLSRLYVAGRINITRLQQEEENKTGHKYISFIRGKRDISQYFIDFLGANEVTIPKKSTSQLIDILNDYMKTDEFENDDEKSRSDYQERTAGYLLECAEHKKEASLKTLSERLDEDEPEAFLTFASAEDYQMPALFHVDKVTVSRLTGVKFKRGGLSITMTKRFVKAHVEVKDNVVILKNVPEELKAQIEYQS